MYATENPSVTEAAHDAVGNDGADDGYDDADYDLRYPVFHQSATPSKTLSIATSLNPNRQLPSSITGTCNLLSQKNPATSLNPTLRTQLLSAPKRAASERSTRWIPAQPFCPCCASPPSAPILLRL